MLYAVQTNARLELLRAGVLRRSSGAKPPGLLLKPVPHAATKNKS